MDDKDPTSVIKMIKDLQAGSEVFRRSSSSNISIGLSSTGCTPQFFSNSIISPKRPKLDESVSPVANKSILDPPGSPWEWRRLKGELISLKTRLSHQEATVQQHHKIRKQIEEVFEKEKSLLEMQLGQEKDTIKQLELRLDVARRNLQEAQQAQAAAEKELHQVKTEFDQKTSTLMNENTKLLEQVRTASMKERMSLHNASTAPSSLDTELKLVAAEERIAQLQDKLKEHLTLQQKCELQNVELQTLKIKLEKLESERAQWEEGKVMLSRAAKASELEKELHNATETIIKLRESVRGKLLLEEQMANMATKLEYVERLEQQVTALEVQKSEVLSRLQEYESIGITGGPVVLKRELHRLQQAEAVLLAEEGRLKSKLDATTRQCETLLKNYEEAKQVATNMKEKLNMLMSRLEKKILLITRERDSYRQQLDLYEKEMTTVDGNSAITERIPALERTIDGYRELVAKLEADLQAGGSFAQREECNKLREEIEKLKGELEHRALKGDFNCNARVLHFTMNPAALAAQQAEEKRIALLNELEELRAKVNLGIVGPATPSSLQTQEIAEIKQTHEIKIARLKEAFKASSQEYRQACYQLFGWRIDRTKEGRYKLSSQYAESPDDFLFFNVGEDGVDLLETAFSATLGHWIEQHLQKQHSVPMFLNAVQSELFSQQTMTNIVN